MKTKNTLLVQEFLKTNTLQNLIDKHGVYASPSKCGHKISLNYSQLESSNSDKLAQQCRGLILRRDKNLMFPITSEGKLDVNKIIGKTKIVAYPFDRFFNYGMEEVNIDWSDNNLRVVEKLDGTLMIVYFDSYQNKWHAATRSVPEADLDNNGFTFRELFDNGLKNNYNIKLDDCFLDKNYTYMFELTSYYNRVVVDYKETTITLIGARHNGTLKEVNIYVDINNYICENTLLNKVKKYSLTDIDLILNHVNDLNPLESEGIVAYDSQYRRVKVKNAGYVALHHTISSIGSSNRNLLSLIMGGNDDDVLARLPDDLAETLMNVKLYFVNLSKKIDSDFNMFLKMSEESDEPNKRKAFALVLKQYNINWQAPFFQMYNKKAENFLDFIEKSKNSNGDWSNSFKDTILNSLTQLGLSI